MQRAALIFNPAAGTRRASRVHDVEAARAVFHDAGIETTVVETSATSGAAGDILQRIEGAVDAVIVCGGDGTVNDVLQAFARDGHRAALGIIPQGSGNLLAREFQMPRRVKDAAQAILRAERRTVPLACIETIAPTEPKRRYWLGAVGIGVDAGVIDRIHPRVKARFGRVAYYFAASRHVLFSRERFAAFGAQWLDEERKLHSETVTQVVLERINYFGPCIEPASSGDLEANQLRAVLFKTHRRSAYAQYGVRQVANLLWGHRGRVPQVEVARLREVNCFPVGGDSGPVLAEVDGQIFGRLPVKIYISDATVDVLVPR
jgi:diacylglycerol kinase family enzyme